MLTENEHRVIELAGELWNRLCRIVADGPSRAGDLAELVHHVHAIQNAVMAQAAGRAHPDRYRLLGEAAGSATQAIGGRAVVPVAPQEDT